MKLNNIPDNGYEFTEELEAKEKAQERLKWVSEGITLYRQLTKRERQVAHRMISSRRTQQSIADELNLSQQRVAKIWKIICFKGKLGGSGGYKGK
jgi:FixJ family two-component response regulator|tara:strand:- start:38 stop:322 length:285 start_codon:yes stop_codon:yes gene_type:complete